MSTKKLLVNVNISADKNYPIFINSDLIEEIPNKISQLTNANKFLLIISKKVNDLYGKKLNFKNSVKFILPDGEKEKNFKNFQKILNFALKHKLERKDAIIAIGGGVVGDLSGFVASTYLRGIEFIQVPTTLLACVDSSVGGKTAINTDYGKNLIGTFYQPKAVFCNLNFLKTLDERQYKTGLAEIVKYAFIEKSCEHETDYNLFEFLENNADKILVRDDETLAELIKISLELKSCVVSKDEKESGLRKILNFGHTYAHAVEKLTNYRKFTHGEAVALGMTYAIKLAFKKSLITTDYMNRGLNLVNKFEINSKDYSFDLEKISKLMQSDKKVEDGKINFILPSCEKYVSLIEINQNELI